MKFFVITSIFDNFIFSATNAMSSLTNQCELCLKLQSAMKSGGERIVIMANDAFQAKIFIRIMNFLFTGKLHARHGNEHGSKLSSRFSVISMSGAINVIELVD